MFQENNVITVKRNINYFFVLEFLEAINRYKKLKIIDTKFDDLFNQLYAHILEKTKLPFDTDVVNIFYGIEQELEN